MMKNEGTSDENKNASSPSPPSSGRSAPIVNLLSSLAEDPSAYVSLSPLKSRKPAAAAADSVGSWRVRLNWLPRWGTSRTTCECNHDRLLFCPYL